MKNWLLIVPDRQRDRETERDQAQGNCLLLLPVAGVVLVAAAFPKGMAPLVMASHNMAIKATQAHLAGSSVRPTNAGTPTAQRRTPACRPVLRARTPARRPTLRACSRAPVSRLAGLQRAAGSDLEFFLGLNCVQTTIVASTWYPAPQGIVAISLTRRTRQHMPLPPACTGPGTTASATPRSAP